MYLNDLCLSHSDVLLGNDFWCAQRTIRFRYMPELGRIQAHILYITVDKYLVRCEVHVLYAKDKNIHHDGRVSECVSAMSFR